jgi:CheY-like chemotaxis protein
MTLPDGGNRDIATHAQPVRDGATGAGKTVLIADDDPVVHDVLRATLAKEGYTLVHAYDGTQALALARETAPDIITLDVMMPKLDGWTVLGRLKSDPELARIPVIMLTIVDERSTGYSLGAAEYMTKPVDRARLVELVHRFAPDGVVLVVDDDDDVRKIVTSTVAKAGLQTAEAINGKDALEWLAKNRAPSLILLDLMMPMMDGFEFLERVHVDDKFNRIPIVVLTAKELTAAERKQINERTMLVLTKGAQPLSSLGSALAAIARRPAEIAAAPSQKTPEENTDA